MFDNTIDHTRGGAAFSEEAYTDFPAYLRTRHTFSDMLCHEAELAAVRLAEKGIFEKVDRFEPYKPVTPVEFLRGMFQLSGEATAASSEEDVIGLAEDKGWLSAEKHPYYHATLTREWMAYLLVCACGEPDNAAQYRLMLNDYTAADERLRSAILGCIARGLWPLERCFSPKKPVNRAECAQVLYRLAVPSQRLVLPYDLGDAYCAGKTDYLVKNTFVPNDGGIMLGTWSGYNWQNFTFRQFGKRTVDRVDFHKWCHYELEKGVYTFPTFENEKCAHAVGSTVITSVEVMANLEWNPRFHKNMIPSFYKLDMTDPETRQAAKNFLRAFVMKMMTELKGDVWLSLDYETDWEMNFDHEADEGAQWRAATWGKWYVEAAEVMRDAAAEVDAGDRLKLMVIYNNVNDLTKLGKEKNQWMLDVAEASDIIGIDVYYYNLVADKTDPAKFMQDMRYLMNNYSLGKPVMVIENGIPLDGMEPQYEKVMAGYFRNLFREFQFVLEKGDYLNRNLSAYLFWDMIRADEYGPGHTGVYAVDGTPYEAGAVLKEWIGRLEGIRHYCPVQLAATENADSADAVPVKVQSGNSFDRLTLLTKTFAAEKTLTVELETPGTVFITVNGEAHFVSTALTTTHSIAIPYGLQDGMNQIDIFFGNDKIPMEQTVKSVRLL